MRFDLTFDTGTVADVARNARSGSWAPGRAAATSIRNDTKQVVRSVAYHEVFDVPVNIRVEQRSRTAHHRDSDNVSGPAKAIIDGLVDAGVIAEDCTCHVRDVTLRQHNGCEDVREGVHEFVVTISKAL